MIGLGSDKNIPDDLGRKRVHSKDVVESAEAWNFEPFPTCLLARSDHIFKSSHILNPHHPQTFEIQSLP